MNDKLGTWVAVLAGMLLHSVVLAAGNADAGREKAAVCMACHGNDGNSPTDAWPKIAGQLPEYIGRQLHDFRHGRRRDEQMSPMAQPLSDQDIADLAAYFAAQKIARVEADRQQVALGEKLFRRGKGRPGPVPACAGCHGPNGGGKTDWSATMKAAPALLAPAIASQHPAYTARQLVAYKVGSRRNDPGHVMRDIAGRLSDDEIAALAQYIATLSP